MNEPLLQIQGLSVHYMVKTGFGTYFQSKDKRTVKAVDGISFDIRAREILALVGESGSGKTTTGRAILRLVKATRGSIEYEGKNLLSFAKTQLKEFRRKAQMIFQDPYQSLNPRETVAQIVGEPLEIHFPKLPASEKRQRIVQALEGCDLMPASRFLKHFPHELSGGQRQRVAIASALILQPQFLVADEPVSMLDASVRLDILRLLTSLRQEKGISCLFITHDLALAWLIADRIAVMYAGKIVEIASSQRIIESSTHPYSRALIAALPSFSSEKKRSRIPPMAAHTSKSSRFCAFYTKCTYANQTCEEKSPELLEIEPAHFVACHTATSLFGKE